MVCNKSETWDALEECIKLGVPCETPNLHEGAVRMYSDTGRLQEIFRMNVEWESDTSYESKTPSEIVVCEAVARARAAEREAILAWHGVPSWIPEDQKVKKTRKRREGPKCSHIITRGDRKGETCTSCAAADSTTCRIHSVDYINMMKEARLEEKLKAEAESVGPCAAIVYSAKDTCGRSIPPGASVCKYHTQDQVDMSRRLAEKVLGLGSYAHNPQIPYN